MFNNFLNSVAQTVAQGVDEHNREQTGNVQGIAQQQEVQRPSNDQNKSNDLMSNLMNVAQVVGKSLDEQNKSQQGRNLVGEETVTKMDSNIEKPLNTERRKSSIFDGFVHVAQNIAETLTHGVDEHNKEQIGKIEEIVRKVDANDEKVQLNSVHAKELSERRKSSILDGFVHVAQNIAETLTHGVDEHNKEQIGKIEETVTFVDSNDGNVQLNSFHVEKTSNPDTRKSSIKDGFVHIAQTFAETMVHGVDEHNREQIGKINDTVTEVDSNEVDSNDETGELRLIYIEKRSSQDNIKPGPLPAFLHVAQNIAETVAQGVDEHNRAKIGKIDDIVTKVDSKDGKVQLSSIQDDSKPSAEAGGHSFLAGLVNVAQTVVKGVDEHNREQTGNIEGIAKQEAAKTPSNDQNKSNDLMSNLINVAQVVGKSLEEQNKGQQGQNLNEEETVTNVDLKDGKVQLNSMHVEKTLNTETGKTGLIAGFVHVAQNIAHSVTHGVEEHNKEQIGIFEETVTKVDSKDGKVELNSIHVDETSNSETGKPGHLAGLAHIAQNIAETVAHGVDEHNREQIGKIDEIVTKVDSKDGKVQLSSTQDDSKPSADSNKPGFLAGLANVAQTIAKGVDEHNREQTGNIEGIGKKVPSEGQLNDSDLKAIGGNIGSIVGGLFKKGGDKNDDEFKSDAIIDDIEGEIGKATISGYTSVQKR